MAQLLFLCGRGEPERSLIPWVQAFQCVSEKAVDQAEQVLRNMLEHTPQAIMKRLCQNMADVAVIGRQQATSDMPMHSFLEGQDSDYGHRPCHGGMRGAGGSWTVPTASVGEQKSKVQIGMCATQDSLGAGRSHPRPVHSSAPQPTPPCKPFAWPSVVPVSRARRGMRLSILISRQSCNSLLASVVGEENLLMEDGACYCVLIHTLAHSVMSFMEDDDRQAVISAYFNARATLLYRPGCYMMSSADEYWAEGAQAWFEGTARTGTSGFS